MTTPHDPLARSLADVHSALVDLDERLTETNRILPTLRSEVDERVAEALATAAEAAAAASLTEARVARYRRLLVAAAIVPVLAILALLISTFILAAMNRTTVETIEDCTKQTGVCYQSNAVAEHEAIEAINAAGDARRDALIEALCDHMAADGHQSDACEP